MCKFHKDVAREIATDPLTGGFDPLAYSIGLAALARYWIDRYIPEMTNCDGYSNYEMASRAGISAFEKSFLPKDIDSINAYHADTIGDLRAAVKAVIETKGLTLAALNLPKNPVKNTRFLDIAMADIYEGDPAIGLMLRSAAKAPSQDPLRNAVSALFAQDGIEEKLQKIQEGSFSKLFLEAPDKINPALLKAYEHIPQGLRSSFKACAMCAGTGTGGALVSHAGCVLVPVFAGASGSALSAQLMSAMLVTSPVLAAGVTAGIDKLQNKGFSFVKVGASAALGLAIAAGLNATNDHSHHAGSHSHSHGHASDYQAQQWLDDLSPEQRRDFRDYALAIRQTELEAAKAMCLQPAETASGASKPRQVLQVNNLS